jgi:hypothetical protein
MSNGIWTVKEKNILDDKIVDLNPLDIILITVT